MVRSSMVEVSANGREVAGLGGGREEGRYEFPGKKKGSRMAGPKKEKKKVRERKKGGGKKKLLTN